MAAIAPSSSANGRIIHGFGDVIAKIFTDKRGRVN